MIQHTIYTYSGNDILKFQYSQSLVRMITLQKEDMHGVKLSYHMFEDLCTVTDVERQLYKKLPVT